MLKNECQFLCATLRWTPVYRCGLVDYRTDYNKLILLVKMYLLRIKNYSTQTKKVK